MAQRIKRHPGRVTVDPKNIQTLGARRRARRHRRMSSWLDLGRQSGGVFSNNILQENGFSFTLEDGSGNLVLE